MSDFRIHTIDTAPDAARPALEKAKDTFGAIPNLFGVLAEAPAALHAYQQLDGLLQKETAFDPTEQHVILLTVSFEHDCEYCMAAHSATGTQKQVQNDVLEALRGGREIEDSKLEALRRFTRNVVERRGYLSKDDLESFYAAGYERRHVLEVLVGVAMKTLSNYTNHIAETPLDEPFQKFAWTKPEVSV